jgi:hypothetical protein
MKTMARLVMLLVVVTICLPVRGDILIYNKTVTWEGVDLGEEDDVYRETDRGFLILEVTYEGDEITSVDNAIQIIYGGRGQDKWIDEWTHNLDIQRFQDGNIIGYGLVEYDSDDGYFYALWISGRAKEQNIGNADPNEVPQSLVGTAIEHDTGNYSERGTYNLRLNNPATRAANEESMDFEQAYDMVIEHLNARGYPSIT